MPETGTQTGHIFAFVTGDRVKWEDENGEPVEDGIIENGWVDTRWSTTEFYESRNDVSPMVDVDLADRETLQDEITSALEWLDGGYSDNGDGTFYAVDSYQPYASDLDDRGDWSYSYALHFVHKFYGPDGWTEQAWHPVKDGGFEL